MKMTLEKQIEIKKSELRSLLKSVRSLDADVCIALHALTLTEIQWFKKRISNRQKEINKIEKQLLKMGVHI